MHGMTARLGISLFGIFFKVILLVLYYTIFIYLGFLAFLLWCHVRLDEELSKEEEERQDVNNVNCGNSNGKMVASEDDKVRSLCHHANKLNQLQ